MPPTVRFRGRPGPACEPALRGRPGPSGSGPRVEPAAKLSARQLSLWFGPTRVLHGITLDLWAGSITALIGPSGCGKTTFLRALNRLHEGRPGLRVAGQVLLDGQPVYAPGMDLVTLRRRVGMIFQQPNPFPRSIYDNVAYGPRLHGVRSRRQLDDIVERCLRWAALWEEVRHRLRRPALELSGGQQQRLCLARALAVEPEVLLLDEPTAALDPIATERLEERILKLKGRLTLVLVTHNLPQARRLAERTAFFHAGALVEAGETPALFQAPQHLLTAAYLARAGGISAPAHTASDPCQKS